MKKLFVIILLAFAFTASAQYEGKVIQIHRSAYEPGATCSGRPVTDYVKIAIQVTSTDTRLCFFPIAGGTATETEIGRDVLAIALTAFSNGETVKTVVSTESCDHFGTPAYRLIYLQLKK